MTQHLSGDVWASPSTPASVLRPRSRHHDGRPEHLDSLKPITEFDLDGVEPTFHPIGDLSM
ncbi:MAG: hypothetical protein ACLSGS_04835 [Adlercreutzia sp.]